MVLLTKSSGLIIKGGLKMSLMGGLKIEGSLKLDGLTSQRPLYNGIHHKTTPEKGPFQN